MIAPKKLPLDILPHMSYIKDMVMGDKARTNWARRPK
jgi:hypothetical protein